MLSDLDSPRCNHMYRGVYRLDLGRDYGLRLYVLSLLKDQLIRLGDLKTKFANRNKTVTPFSMLL